MTRKASRKVGGASVLINVTVSPGGQWWAEKIMIRECDIPPALRERVFGRMRA